MPQLGWEHHIARRIGWLKMTANARGAIWVLLAGLLFALMGVMVKAMGNRLDSFQVAFFRALFGLLCILPFAIVAGPKVLKTRRLPMHIWRGAIGMCGMFSGFYAITHLSLADATALSFTKPLFLTILASVLLGETLRIRRITATTIGFIGVVIMLRPGMGVIQPAALIALLGALAVAFVVVTVKKLVETEQPVTVLFYFGLFSTSIAAVPLWFVWETPTKAELIGLMLTGVLGATAQSCMIRGYQASEATAVASLDYFRMLYAVAFGYLFFSELPDVWTVTGAGVIIASTLYIFHRERVLGKARPAPVLDQTPLSPNELSTKDKRPRQPAE